MNLKQKVKEIKSGKLKAVENVMNFGEIIKKRNKELNVFLHLNENAIDEAKAIDKRIKQGERVGKLAGLCFAVKSNISVKNMVVNCASKVLENYVSGYDASVIQKLISEDAIVLGMVNMDEFACGSSGETSAFGPTKNPLNTELIPGGSSSGPVVAVAAEMCDFALGSDTGGSIRNPASHCGVVGLKPSYGAVSRYGLLDLTMSTDTIAPVTKNVEDNQLIFDVIKGQDNFDATTNDFSELKSVKKKPVLGLVNVEDFADKEIVELIETKAKEMADKNGWKIKKVSLPLDIGIETYYILTYVEFFSATRKFDGRRFGFKIEDKAGAEVLRRILGGSEISQAEYSGKYYRNALKARAYVRGQFEKIFSDVDFLVLPTVPRTAHKIGEKISVEQMYAYDILTIPASIAGLPAISIPVGEVDGKAVGLQIMTRRFEENLLFNVSKVFE